MFYQETGTLYYKTKIQIDDIIVVSAVRKTIENAFNTRLINSFGHTECCAVGISCLFSNNLHKYLAQLQKINAQNIRSFSILTFGLGLCLIYFTLRFYG